MKAKLIIFLILTFAFLLDSYAGSATWNSAPPNNNWNRATNWTPVTVPNGFADTATFATSSMTGLSVTAHIEVNTMIFNSGASAFTISTAANDLTFTFSGAGITNNSAVTQSFVTTPSNQVSLPGGQLIFTNSATAGTGTLLTNNGSMSSITDGGSTSFFNTATAGNATVINHSAPMFGFGENAGNTTFYDNAAAGNAVVTDNGATADMAYGGATHFTDSSSAGNATLTNTAGTGGGNSGATYFTELATAGDASFTNNGGTGPATIGGFVNFSGSATAGNATFHNLGGTVSGAIGGYIQFYDTSTAGDATFTCEGGPVSGASGGQLVFTGGNGGNSTIVLNGGTANGASGGFLDFSVGGNAGNCTVIANDAQAPGAFGGEVAFDSDSIGGTARIEVFGAGTLCLDVGPGVTIGSLEGDGLVTPNGNRLTVGANNLNAVFSGKFGGFDKSGSLVKIGTGTLTLTNGGNNYTGGTTIRRGTLLVRNQSGSATGSGPVLVTSGTLGGTGVIAGNVIISIGDGRPAILSPGKKKSLGTLTIQSSLGFNSGAIFDFGLNSTRAATDQVIANGVNTDQGAAFAITDAGNSVLPLGTVFTAISNTAATPIGDTFGNLPDGGTITLGNNTYQANYEGGDGNDLTLTVVP